MCRRHWQCIRGVSVLQGNLDFFHRVIDLSPVLAYVDVDGGPGRDSPDAEISLERDTDYFVFGGDAVYVKDLSSFIFCFGCWTCRPFLPWCSLLNPLRATVLCLWSRKRQNNDGANTPVIQITNRVPRGLMGTKKRGSDGISLRGGGQR